MSGMLGAAASSNYLSRFLSLSAEWERELKLPRTTPDGEEPISPAYLFRNFMYPRCGAGWLTTEHESCRMRAPKLLRNARGKKSANQAGANSSLRLEDATAFYLKKGGEVGGGGWANHLPPPPPPPHPPTPPTPTTPTPPPQHIHPPTTPPNPSPQPPPNPPPTPPNAHPPGTPRTQAPRPPPPGLLGSIEHVGTICGIK